MWPMRNDASGIVPILAFDGLSEAPGDVLI